MVASFKFPENEDAIICVVRSRPTCCVKELMVLPWNLLKNPTPVDSVLVTKVDTNISFDVIFAEEILLTKRACVLNTKREEESPDAIALEIDEIPSAKIEYSVEFVEPIEVLTVEKYVK